MTPLRSHALLAVGLGLLAALAAPAPSAGAALPPGAVADRVLIEKAQRRLTLFSGSRPLKSYRVALGDHPIGRKQREGDGRTPEGLYVIDSRNRQSRFHRALHVSYPNPADRERARRLGVAPGGDIMIHGLLDAFAPLGPLHRLTDWTSGCIAVTDDEIEEIWRAVPNGTRVEIRP